MDRKWLFSGEAEQHWLAAEREILSALQSPNSPAQFRPTETRDAEAEILEELRQSLSGRKSGGALGE